MPPEMTWRKAIDRVLAESKTPLRYKDITERIIAQSLRTNLSATRRRAIVAFVTVMDARARAAAAAGLTARAALLMHLSAATLQLKCAARSASAPGGSSSG